MYRESRSSSLTLKLQRKNHRGVASDKLYNSTVTVTYTEMKQWNGIHLDLCNCLGDSASTSQLVCTLLLDCLWTPFIHNHGVCMREYDNRTIYIL